jgi:hypothetical protein
MSAHFATSRPSVQVPALTGEQMREVDRIMMEELHIQLAQMMENAGRNLADLALRRFHPRRSPSWPGPAATVGAGWWPPDTYPTGVPECRSLSPASPCK